MTPIPPAVAAAIVAAGHSLSAEPYSPDGYRGGAWSWPAGGAAVAPHWRVEAGNLGHSGSRGTGYDPSPRSALLGALASLAKSYDHAARATRDEARRVRLADRKARREADAAAIEQRAADVRTLAATIAAMWPAPPALSAAEVAATFPGVSL